MKIYFDGGDEAKTLLELFTIGFSEESYGGSIRFKRTFLERHLINQQCHIARRSLDDLLQIAQTYFPASTEEDVLIALNSIKTEKPFKVFYCNATQRPVFVQVDPVGQNLGIHPYRKFGNIYFNMSDGYLDVHEQSNYSIKMIVLLFEKIVKQDKVRKSRNKLLSLYV